ncbi:unnamed protein product [Trichobilharzia szidati]|nr:unnamed protein product [Trichobilharzia szidati]
MYLPRINLVLIEYFLECPLKNKHSSKFFLIPIWSNNNDTHSIVFAMLLINKVLTLWTICCILLFSQISQSNGIIINNWLIVLIPMCFVDFILLITNILFMSGRPPQIFGDYDAGSKLNRTLIVSFMLWKLAGQTVVCLYLEGYVDGLSYNGFRQFHHEIHLRDIALFSQCFLYGLPCSCVY